MRPQLAVDAAITGRPPQWPTRELRWVTRLRTRRNSAGLAQPLSLASSGRVYKRTVDVDRQRSSDETTRRGWLVEPGDLVVNPMWLIGGGIAVSDIRGVVSPDYRVYRFDDVVHPKYMHHLLRSKPFMDQYRLYIRAETTFDRRVSKEDFGSIPVTIPPMRQQQAIAALLDAELGRIDGLIRMRESQVRLLEERSQLVLDEVLSRFGRSVTPLRYLARIVDTEHRTAPHVPEGGHWVAGTGSLRQGHIRSEMLYETDPTSYALWTRRGRPTPGDVLLTREAPVGEVALYRRDDPAAICIGQRVVLVKPSERLLPEYLTWVLQAPATRRFIEDVTQGSLHPHLNMSDVGRIPIPAPAIDAQNQTLSEIYAVVGGQRRTIAALSASAVLLRERRQAVTTAAVLGQLDMPTTRGVAS